MINESSVNDADAVTDADSKEDASNAKEEDNALSEEDELGAEWTKVYDDIDAYPEVAVKDRILQFSGAGAANGRVFA